MAVSSVDGAVAADATLAGFALFRAAVASAVGPASTVDAASALDALG